MNYLCIVMFLFMKVVIPTTVLRAPVVIRECALKKKMATGVTALLDSLDRIVRVSILFELIVCHEAASHDLEFVKAKSVSMSVNKRYIVLYSINHRNWRHREKVRGSTVSGYESKTSKDDACRFCFQSE